MFSKSESKQIRQEFWTNFGKEYPRKWLLYNTKIKDVTLKFTFTTKKAQVSIDIEPTDEIIKAYYYDKFISLKKILTSEFIEDIIYNKFYELDNGKIVSRIYVEIDNVSIHNRKTWTETMIFLSKNMAKLEEFFLEYKEYISD
ncbi:uncharacterized protein DUF4268 [Aquimarina sp. MAR_2010_214]|uniref:DUF4268 domain-containing protein n=1 Tax=Aquimarina sp. MAR_2010_214 TaxID=1250026 RepID=UPI000C708FAF|nr:DUF4268 domain-containing protein [Aquimarina sp. MAR_2010_214]PKV51705.1 uncharacterized protein DUF4268 [Aquimarina sp. MAR_2010_214]